MCEALAFSTLEKQELAESFNFGGTTVSIKMHGQLMGKSKFNSISRFYPYRLYEHLVNMRGSVQWWLAARLVGELLTNQPAYQGHCEKFAVYFLGCRPKDITDELTGLVVMDCISSA
jgi:hypothetical protein